MSELVRRGYCVLVPWGFNHRYDLVLDVSGRFLRAQCKTGRLRNGAIAFRTCSVRSNTKRAYLRDYKGEVDLFLVYCPETEGTYAVPAEVAPSNMMHLRVDRCRNRQRENIRWARDHDIARLAQLVEHGACNAGGLGSSPRAGSGLSPPPMKSPA